MSQKKIVKSLKVFVLEDEIDRYPRNQILAALVGHTVTVARNVPEAKRVYKGGYDLLLLDHDMEGFFEDPEANHGNTGTAFVRWLVQRWRDQTSPLDEDELPDVILHSQNPSGRKEMSLTLRDAGADVQQVPFSPDYVKALRDL